MRLGIEHLVIGVAIAAGGGRQGAVSCEPPEDGAPVVKERLAHAAVGLERDGASVRVTIDGDLFTVYHEEGQSKPYLWPVRAAGGAEVTRAHPLAARPGEADDHPHHVSMWLAHGDVNGHDFWASSGGERIEPVREAELLADDGAVRAILAWRDPAGETVLTETRTMRFGGAGAARWIEIDSALRASNGDVVFGDTKEGTAAMRLAPSLRLEGEVARGRAVNSAGDEDGDCWGKRAAWVAYEGPIGEHVIEVRLFDHPDNPRHPTWWHARRYGLVAANPFGVHDFEGKPEGTGDLRLPNGEALRLRYLFLIRSRGADEPPFGAMDAPWGRREQGAGEQERSP